MIPKTEARAQALAERRRFARSLAPDLRAALEARLADRLEGPAFNH